MWTFREPAKNIGSCMAKERLNIRLYLHILSWAEGEELEHTPLKRPIIQISGTLDKGKLS